MIKFLTNPLSLDEQLALDSMSCYQCDGDIEIGDNCYVDTTQGSEEKRAKIFCESCYKEAILYGVSDKSS